MPIFSPPQSPRRTRMPQPRRRVPSRFPTRRPRFWIHVALLLTVVGLVSPSPAQTLARPGLAGSGLKNSPWWQHAVFYQVGRSPDSLDFKAISARLDALRSLG